MKLTRRSFIGGILAGLGALAIGRIAPEEDTLDDTYIWGDAASEFEPSPTPWVGLPWSEYKCDNRIIGLYAGDGNVVMQGTMAHPIITRKFAAAQNLRTGDCVELDSSGKLIKAQRGLE